MITIMLYYGTDLQFVKVDGNSVTFSDNNVNWATIDKINISYKGVLIEHPDLKDRKDWKEEAIKRFKENIKAMETEEEVKDYIIAELQKHGYIASKINKNGWRGVNV